MKKSTNTASSKSALLKNQESVGVRNAREEGKWNGGLERYRRTKKKEEKKRQGRNYGQENNFFAVVHEG